MNKIFSFDAETNGLWGQAFSIAAVVYSANGEEISTFSARCQIEGDVNPWVEKEVLPQMKEIPVTHESYEEMLKAFAEFYMANKTDADVIFHMGVPVEARVILDMHRFKFIGDWDGAFPWIDIAGNLKQAGFDPTSVDRYNKEHNIEVPMLEAGGTHNPLYDSRAAALCYMHLMNR